MHIPDGFLEPKVWAPLTFISGGAVLAASKKVGRNMDEKLVPLMGVLAAFVFAAQMVNFPIGGGTSGHLMGGVLIAAIVGPYAALLIMTTILALQALMFQDGGITALGANIFNMGIVGAGSGYIIYSGLTRITGNFRASVFIASWFSVVLASASAALQLSLSGIVPLKVSFPAMAGVHAIIGIGEGAITIAALGLIRKVKSDAVHVSQVRDEKVKKLAWIWLAASVIVVVALAPFASSLPDGLEKVAEKLGFLSRGTSHINSPLPDYQIPGLAGGISTAVAGVVGVIIAFCLAYFVVKALHGKGKR